jgi:hypothetical protein
MSSADASPPIVDTSSADLNAATKVAHVYNRFLVDMMLNLKGANGGVLKKALKTAGHKAIDPTSLSYVEHASSGLPLAALTTKAPTTDGDIFENDEVLAFEPLKGVAIRVVVEAVSDDKEAANSARCYLYILAVLCATYTECASGSVDGNGALVSNVLEALSRIQNGGSDNVDVDGIMDDDIVALVNRLEEVTATATVSSSTEEDGKDASCGLEDLLKSLENSKIADLAKEISQDIDVSKFASDAASDNPAELLNFANLGDSNSLLGSIVSKVGNKIQGKLSSGELRHDELLSEAMSLLKAFDTNKTFAGNPMMGNLMKAANNIPGGLQGILGAAAKGGAGNHSGGAHHSARERLRQKLERQRVSDEKSGKKP